MECYSVLMVEDSTEYAHVLSEVLDLSDPGRFHIVVKPSLVSGLDRLRQEHCDVVLLDLGLPDSQGLQTLWAVVETADLVPVIVLTAREEGELAFKCLESGAFAYVVKGEVEQSALSTLVMKAATARREKVPSPELGGTTPSAPADADIYSGEVAILLQSPGGVTRTIAFLTQIHREDGLRVVLQSGSQQDTRWLVKLMAPSPLRERLARMNGVDSVSEHRNLQGEAELTVALS